MISPTLSIVMTINDRPRDVLKRVFDSIRDEPFDQLVICLDATPAPLPYFISEYWSHLGSRLYMVSIVRDPGWLSPVKAWNTAFAHVISELTYCISSEVIQTCGNIARAKEILASEPAVLFGKAECSCGPEGKEVDWGGSAPGNLLVDSAHPRPLGFIMAMPTWLLRATGGYDETFMQGYWYDDDDFVYRLWQQGVPFVFNDTVSGLHQHHARPILDTPSGQAGIANNRSYIIRKHGHERPWAQEKTVIERVSSTRTIIYHA